MKVKWKTKKEDEKLHKKGENNEKENKLDKQKLRFLIKSMAKTTLNRTLEYVEINRESFPLIEFQSILSRNGFRDVLVSHKQHKYPLESIK